MDKITCQVKYKKPGLVLKKTALPTLKHTNDINCVGCNILSAGVIDRDGERLEFQDIRIFLKE